MTAAKYTQDGQSDGTVELPSAVFEAPVSKALVHQAVVAHLANRRQGNAATQTRAMVNGSTAKPWRQKKTGRARIGDRKSPHHRGGGVAFGPSPRSYRQKLNKKMRRTALISTLSAKATDGLVSVLPDLPLESGKTKEVHGVVNAIGLANTDTLWVVHEPTEGFLRACRNLPRLVVEPADAVNIYDVARARHMLVSESAMARLGEGA